MASTASSTRRRRRAEKKSERKEPIPQRRRSLAAGLAAELLPSSSGGRKVLLAALVLGFALRAYNLLGMFPILVDESIYLRWAEIIDHQGQWFISLLDGKPVLSYWVLALQRMVFGGDPLFGARLLSAFIGVLSTLGIFAVAKRLAPEDAQEPAGLIAAGFYAVFPYALLYDRLAYTETWINLAGLVVALASLWCFAREGAGWSPGLAPGLALGLGIFTKQTAILFGLVPAAMALTVGRENSRPWLPRLAAAYAVAFLFLGADSLLTPEAPMLETHSAVLHHTGFFADPQELLKDPFVAARSNLPLLASYAGTYMGWPLVLAGAAAAIWLGRLGSPAPWLLLSTSLIPVVAEAFLLELMFPSRYPFPHFWPWLAVAAAGGATAWKKARQAGTSPARLKIAAAVAGLALVGPMLYRDARMLGSPREGLHASDAKGFLGDHAHVGYGIREAIDFLIAESKNGGFILLADPIWGPPSDAVFPYLNRRYGIRVYEAWWTQLSGTHAILPEGKAEVLKSHYERVVAGAVDFARAKRVYYITDTYYYTQQAVLVRQPNARLIARFKKPIGKDSIDVYRLK